MTFWQGCKQSGSLDTTSWEPLIWSKSLKWKKVENQGFWWLKSRVSPRQGASEGVLYLDDGHSFSYHQSKAFSLRRFTWSSGRLRCWWVSCRTACVLKREPTSVKQTPHQITSFVCFAFATTTSTDNIDYVKSVTPTFEIQLLLGLH